MKLAMQKTMSFVEYHCVSAIVTTGGFNLQA